MTPLLEMKCDSGALAEVSQLAWPSGKHRSGTRSTLLWALAEASQGGDPDALTNMAAKAGYDVGPIRPLMDMLKAKA